MLTIVSTRGFAWTYTRNHEDELWDARREDGRKPMMARKDADMDAMTVAGLRREVDDWDTIR